MPPAIVAAGVAAVGTIGGSIMSSKAQKSAAKSASNAEIAMANQNAALAREFRGANQANFQPYLNSGLRSNSLVDSFLFGPQQAQQGGAMPGQTTAPANTYNGPALNEIMAMQNDGIPGNFRPALAAYHAAQQQQTAQPQPGTVTAAQPAQNPMDGYKTFEASPYYQTGLTEGLRSLNTGYAANGMLQSGAAMKGINKFGQDYAYGKLGEFIGMAERQSDRGIQGASAIAGVGQNALASQTASNNAIGNSMANRAIAGGVAQSNMWSGIGSALGNIAGSIGGGSSYR